MHILLFLLAAIAAVIGGFVLKEAKTTFGEIDGLLLWILAAVLLSGAAIVDAINSAATAARLRAEARSPK